MDLSLLIEKYLERIDEGPGNLSILPKEWLAPLTMRTHVWAGDLAGENSDITELGKFTVKEGKPEEGWRKVREITNRELKKADIRVAGFYFTEDNQPLYLLVNSSDRESQVNLEYTMYYNTGAIEKREKYVTLGKGKRAYSSKQSTDRLTIEDIKDTFTSGPTYRVYAVYIDLKRLQKARERDISKNVKDNLTTIERDAFTKLIRSKLEAKCSALQNSLATESNTLIIEIMMAVSTILNGTGKITWEKRKEIENKSTDLTNKYKDLVKLLYRLDSLAIDSSKIKTTDYTGRLTFSYGSKEILKLIDKI